MVKKELNEALQENARLRQILARSLEALGNGSRCEASASIEFMESIPAEIQSEVDHLRRKASLGPCDASADSDYAHLNPDDFIRAIELLREHEWVTDGRECAVFCLHCLSDFYKGHSDDCEGFGLQGVARSVMTQDRDDS